MIKVNFKQIHSHDAGRGFISGKRIKLDQLLHQQIAIKYLIVGGGEKINFKKIKQRYFNTKTQRQV